MSVLSVEVPYQIQCYFNGKHIGFKFFSRTQYCYLGKCSVHKSKPSSYLLKGFDYKITHKFQNMSSPFWHYCIRIPVARWCIENRNLFFCSSRDCKVQDQDPGVWWRPCSTVPWEKVEEKQGSNERAILTQGCSTTELHPQHPLYSEIRSDYIA